MKAPFIVIDGMDGSGKGTQVKLLAERATREKRKFVTTREPGGTLLAEAIRNLFNSRMGMKASPRTQFLLMCAARSDSLEKVILSNLDAGIPVISDRGDDSTLAYQGYAKQDRDLEEEFWRMKFSMFREYAPAFYLIIDVPAEEAKRRVDADKSRTASDFDLAPLDFYQRVRHGFQAFQAELPNNVMMIDGTRSPGVIHEEIYQIMRELCGWQ